MAPWSYANRVSTVTSPWHPSEMASPFPIMSSNVAHMPSPFPRSRAPEPRRAQMRRRRDLLFFYLPDAYRRLLRLSNGVDSEPAHLCEFRSEIYLGRGAGRGGGGS